MNIENTPIQSPTTGKVYANLAEAIAAEGAHDGKVWFTPSPATDELAPLELPDADLVVDHDILSTRYFELSSVRTIAIEYATAERHRVRAAMEDEITLLKWSNDQLAERLAHQAATLARPATEQSAGTLTASQMRAIAKAIAHRVAKNTNVAPELCFAPALLALQDSFALAAPGAEHIRAEQVQAQPVAEKWAVYYDNLGEQPYTSGWCKPFKLYDSESQALADYQSGTITPAKHYSACKVIVYTAPVQQGQAVAEGYVLALQTVVTMPDGKNELGHTLLDGVGIFNSECEVHEAIAELSLPLGWVSMKTSQLLPGWMLPSHPSTQPAAQSGEARDWPEDFASENGNYANRCRTCEREFMGNKHRRICKVCATSETLALAYGYLWHINAGAGAPAECEVLSITPEQAAYKARKALRDLMTHEQRGIGINAARAAMSQSADGGKHGS